MSSVNSESGSSVSSLSSGMRSVWSFATNRILRRTIQSTEFDTSDSFESKNEATHSADEAGDKGGDDGNKEAGSFESGEVVWAIVDIESTTLWWPGIVFPNKKVCPFPRSPCFYLIFVY